jgi:hypothetical protein
LEENKDSGIPIGKASFDLCSQVRGMRGATPREVVLQIIGIDKAQVAELHVQTCVSTSSFDTPTLVGNPGDMALGTDSGDVDSDERDQEYTPPNRASKTPQAWLGASMRQVI